MRALRMVVEQRPCRALRDVLLEWADSRENVGFADMLAAMEEVPTATRGGIYAATDKRLTRERNAFLSELWFDTLEPESSDKSTR
jgi:hypothetical protein